MNAASIKTQYQTVIKVSSLQAARKAQLAGLISDAVKSCIANALLLASLALASFAAGQYVNAQHDIRFDFARGEAISQKVLDEIEVFPKSMEPFFELEHDELVAHDKDQLRAEWELAIAVHLLVAGFVAQQFFNRRDSEILGKASQQCEAYRP